MTQNKNQLGRWVEVVFDCLPLRTMSEVAIPDDASPRLTAKLRRIRRAIDTHGTFNSYYLHNAHCTYHLTNDPVVGMCQYEFEGVVLTDSGDMQARACELNVTLARETCNWINQPVVDWLAESVQHAVIVEFNRYIQEGDLSKTIARLEALQQATDQSAGFVGMHL